MEHICGKCRVCMVKTQRILHVQASHMRKRSDQAYSEATKIDDGIVPKKTMCYVCPRCGTVVFYGYNYKYGKTEIVD